MMRAHPGACSVTTVGLLERSASLMVSEVPQLGTQQHSDGRSWAVLLGLFDVAAGIVIMSWPGIGLVTPAVGAASYA
jgi:uncharacterized membrane protein HdeD (DUF308 family)